MHSWRGFVFCFSNIVLVLVLKTTGKQMDNLRQVVAEITSTVVE